VVLIFIHLPHTSLLFQHSQFSLTKHIFPNRTPTLQLHLTTTQTPKSLHNATLPLQSVAFNPFCNATLVLWKMFYTRPTRKCSVLLSLNSLLSYCYYPLITFYPTKTKLIKKILNGYSMNINQWFLSPLRRQGFLHSFTFMPKQNLAKRMLFLRRPRFEHTTI